MREGMQNRIAAMRAGLAQFIGIEGPSSDLYFEPIEADGSTRRFFRIADKQRPLCLAVFPGDNSETAYREAKAVYRIGRHLHNRGVAVPKLFGFDSVSGMVMMEDLGDQRLYDYMKLAESDVLAVYEKVIDQLLFMQFEGGGGFDPSWCWDTREYDRHLMLEKESRYFERAFLHDLLGLKSPTGLDKEFEALADLAASGKMRCFLHRDFQSRNIMVSGGTVSFIDFQGGRIGPPGYDLASLLHDPYADLCQETRQALYQYYINHLSGHAKADSQEFGQVYPFLALQRNLQIVGAFSFLYKKRQKTFFKQYIIPALLNLQRLLLYTELQRFTVLRQTVDQSIERTIELLAEK